MTPNRVKITFRWSTDKERYFASVRWPQVPRMCEIIHAEGVIIERGNAHTRVRGTVVGEVRSVTWFGGSQVEIVLGHGADPEDRS